jgi:Domain of unknown function (DUF4390)
MKKTATLFVATMLALLPAMLAWPQENPARVGSFEVRLASLTLVDGIQELDARLQLVLSAEALKALNSGVTLTIELTLEVIRVKRFLPDDGEAELSITYELQYLPLSQRYVVRSVNSGDTDSFATLFSALNNLGRIQSLPVIDDAILNPDSKYRIRLRVSLSTRQYSAPFRFLFFWRDAWDLKSEWYEWRLER